MTNKGWKYRGENKLSRSSLLYSSVRNFKLYSAFISVYNDCADAENGSNGRFRLQVPKGLVSIKVLRVDAIGMMSNRLLDLSVHVFLLFQQAVKVSKTKQ